MSTFLETERLILRPPALSDLDNLIALRADPEVMKYIAYIGTGDPQTPEQVKRFLKIAMDYQEKYGFSFCSVFEKETNHFIGQAGLFHIGFYDEQPDIEIAYRLHQQYWGKGYATEAAKALVAWGFAHLSVNRLVGLLVPENTRSKHVLEKVGMSLTGKLHYDDHIIPCYEIYRKEVLNHVAKHPD